MHKHQAQSHLSSTGDKGRFSTVEFMTASEKEAVLKHWTNLMRWLSANGVPAQMPKLFTKMIYDHLQLHAVGYIAHFNQAGFWEAQLGSPAAATSFFRELEEHLCPRWGALRDYGDINDALLAVAREVRPGILARLAAADRDAARAQIVALASRAGISVDVLDDARGAAVDVLCKAAALPAKASPDAAAQRAVLPQLVSRPSPVEQACLF